MVKYRKCKPMSIKKINLMMKAYESEYRLEKLENGEIVMVKNEKE